MQTRRLIRQRLIALFVLGIVLFNVPFLNLFNHGTTMAGIPVLFIFLFVAWLLLILITRLVVAGWRPARREGDPE